MVAAGPFNEKKNTACELEKSKFLADGKRTEIGSHGLWTPADGKWQELEAIFSGYEAPTEIWVVASDKSSSQKK